jgi:eukaryotic-like serine/threonine-protein kinase
MKREAYHESQIDEAVAEWETRCGRGENVPLSEFCVDYPTDIREEVARRVRALDSIDLLLAAAESDKSQQADTDGAANREFPIELPRMLGRYQLLECVGQGGFGQVWRGRDTELERDVAVKIPRPDRLGSVHQAKKFLEEARKAAKLDHPGIVPVFDYGRQGAYYYIVSKWIDGPSLAKYLSTERPTPAEAARIVSEVADALHHAHLRDLVHRDIKPGNILLDTHGKAYVTDFGIAVTEDELLEEHGGVSGTIGYMAPEQAAGETIVSHLAPTSTAWGWCFTNC